MTGSLQELQAQHCEWRRCVVGPRGIVHRTWLRRHAISQPRTHGEQGTIVGHMKRLRSGTVFSPTSYFRPDKGRWKNVIMFKPILLFLRIDVPCRDYVENGGPVAEQVCVVGFPILDTAMCFRSRFPPRQGPLAARCGGSARLADCLHANGRATLFCSCAIELDLRASHPQLYLALGERAHVLNRDSFCPEARQRHDDVQC